MSNIVLRIGTIVVAFALLMGPMSAFVSDSQVIPGVVVNNMPDDAFDSLQVSAGEIVGNDPVHIKDPVTVMVVCTNPSKVAQSLSGIPYRGFLSQRENGEIISPVLTIPRYAIDILENTEGVLAILDYNELLSKGNNGGEISFPSGSDMDGISSIFDTKQHYGSEAWSKGFTGEGITVAVTQFGIDFSQPDIMGTQARVTDTNSPYYGWPVVFDSASLTAYMSSGGDTEGTWFVNTSAERGIDHTETYDMTINTESEWALILPMANESVFGPAIGGEKGPFSLDNIKIINQTLYYSTAAGAWTMMVLDTHYTFNTNTGLIMLKSPALAELTAGMTIWAYYNFTNPHIFEVTGSIASPSIAGTPESLVLDGFTPGKPYVFAIRATDEAGNMGPISNSPTVTAKEDITPPSKVNNLVATPGKDHGTVNLAWTAPGDDGAVGSASSYIISYSDLPIANIHCFRHLSTEITNMVVPAVSGTNEELIAIDLEPEKEFYFAMVAVDEAGNWGPVSNYDMATVTNDTMKPEAITDLTATSVGAAHTGVVLNWTAPHDEGATGSSCVRYEGRYSGNPILTENDWQNAYVISASELPAPAAPGTPQTAQVVTGMAGPISITVANESVYGPATGNGTESGPWYLDNTGVTDMTLYRQYNDSGSWELQLLQQGTEYTFDQPTSEINLIGWAGGTSSVVYQPVFIGPVDPIPDFYLPHGNITSVTLYYYLDATPEVIDLYEGSDYECDYASGLITGLDVSWGFLDPGDIIYADYTYANVVTSLQAEDSLLAYYNYSAIMPMYFALRGVDELGRMGDISSTSGFVAIDGIVPGQVSNITVETGILHGMVFLNFTATGDDAGIGTAKRYIVKYSSTPITNDAEFTAATEWVWADPDYSGSMLPQLKWNPPKSSGQNESYQFGFGSGNAFFNLINPTYFAVKVRDEAGNLGPLSDCVSAVAQNDVTPPATIALTAVTGPTHGSVTLSWVTPGDDGATGQLFGDPPYTIKWSTAPIDTVQNFDDAVGMVLTEAKAPGMIESLNITGFTPGQQYYFAVCARDDAGLLSALPVSTFATSKNDIIAPGAITLVTVTGDQNGQVKLNFNAPGNDGSTGAAKAYELRYREYIPVGQFIQYGFDQLGILNITMIPYIYNVTGITSQSGTYKIGMHIDQNTATYVNGNLTMGFVNYSAVLVVDSVTAHVYDTVYVDLDNDRDFSDEKPCRKGDEASYRDMDGNGIPDVSGGMIYFIGSATVVPSEALTVLGGGTYALPTHGNIVNSSWAVFQSGNPMPADKYSVTLNETGFINVTFSPALTTTTGITIRYEYNGLALPYSERYAQRYDITNVIPGNGDLVAFMGEFALDSTSGTSMASSIVGQGNLRFQDDTSIRPVVGMAPDAKIITVADMGFDGIIFALEGYDGIPMTGDEANIVSSTMSSSAYEAGLDFTSNYMDWLATTYCGGRSSIVVTSGENGPGYGTVSSPGTASGVITAGLVTDLHYRAIGGIYENGPLAMFGDMVSISGRGPTVAGNPKPDVVAAGAYFGFVSQPLYMPDATPLAPYNNLVELWMSGHGLTSAVASASVALVYQAYDVGHGAMPQGSEVHEILMSGADDLCYDIFTQGAGQINASRSVDIASNTAGISVSPHNWVPGEYDGVQYETFIKLVDQDTSAANLTETFTVKNHYNSTQSVSVQPEILSKYGEIVTTVTTTKDLPHENIILNETGFYYRDGRVLQLFEDPSIWTDAELLKVTAYNKNDTGYWFELFAWTDKNSNGIADGDNDEDPYPGAVAWDERNRLSMSTVYTNKHEISVQHPADRVGDGLLMWIRSVGGPDYDCKWVIKAEAFQKADWDWISIDKPSLNIPTHSQGTFTATVDRAKALAAGPGTYDGAIMVGGANGALIPVVVNVPLGSDSAIEPTTYSMPLEIADADYNRSREVSNETCINKVLMVDGDFDFYLKHTNINELARVQVSRLKYITYTEVVNMTTWNVTIDITEQWLDWVDIPIENFTVDSKTGLATILNKNEAGPTYMLYGNATVYTWYSYFVDDVHLSHSSIIPGTMTVYKDGVSTLEFGSVAGLQIFKNRDDVVEEFIINATGGETTVNLANGAGPEMISGYTIYLNDTAMSEDIDYIIDKVTGAIYFEVSLKKGMVITADYYSYDPNVTQIQLAHKELSPGRFDINNLNGYNIFLNGAPMGDADVFVNTTSGLLTFTNPVPAGAIITADYKYGTYVPDYSRGVIDFKIPPTLGTNITVTYDYYDSITPYTHSYMIGGSDGSGSGKGGDWRYYYTHLADGPLNRNPSNKMAIDVSWARAGSDVDAFLFTEAGLSTPSVGSFEFNVSRYGPCTVANSGGSSESATLFTASGGPSDFALVPPTPGLNVLALHNVRFNGTMDVEAVSAKIGRMTLNRDTIDIVTNSLSGEEVIRASSSLELGGMLSGIAAGPSAPEVRKDLLAYQDDPAWENFPLGFEQQLASGRNLQHITLKDCLIFNVRILGHDDTYTREGSYNDVVDLDLGVFLDANGNGLPDLGEMYAMDADFNADEQVKLINPPDGNYIVVAYGFTLKSEPGHYDMEITIVQGLGFTVTGEGIDTKPDNSEMWISLDPLPPFTQSSVTLGYNLPSAKDGVILQGALFLGPGNAPYAMLIPITLRYDSIAPSITSHNPVEGSMIFNKKPTFTISFDDPMGELVKKDVMIEVDGVDVTSVSAVNIPLVDDDVSPVQGHPSGTITYNPPAEISEGVHVVTAMMRDKAGNVATKSWSFFIDSSAPELILDPEYERTIYTNDATLTIRGQVENGVDLKVPGVSQDMLQYNNDGTFSVTVTLEPGENVIQISATDAAGNRAVTYCTAILDTTSPAFTSVRFSSGFMTNSPYTTLSGKMSEPGIMSVNGAAITVNSDGSYEKVISLNEGVNTIHLEFTDHAGNVAHSWQNVTLDTIAPTISLGSAPAKIDTQSLTLAGSVEANSELLVNGKRISLGTRQSTSDFTTTLTLSEGMNTIVIEARDSAGNVAELRYIVEYDTSGDGGTNFAAIGLMVALLVVGLILGMFLGPMILGGPKEDAPEEELPPVESDGDMISESEMPEEEVHEVESEPVEAQDEIGESEAEPIPAEESLPEELPAETEVAPESEVLPEEPVAPAEPEDPRIVKLRDAYESGKISKELYEKNLAKFQGK